MMMTMMMMMIVSAFSAFVLGAVTPANCAWENAGKEPRCTAKTQSWEGRYPNCTLFQFANYTPIPCQGATKEDYCKFEGQYANSSRPQPASYHIHVFFPNKACSNCSAAFRNETKDYSYPGAMRLRGEIAHMLNTVASRILSLRNSTLIDPIDAIKAAQDPAHNRCGDVYKIVAGAPASFHAEPCIFEVDAVKEGGPSPIPRRARGTPITPSLFRQIHGCRGWYE
jgi:hypothetical protein